MTLECGIIEDLLPLYAEGIAGKASCEAVEEHIKSCEHCRALLDDMRAKTPETPAAAPLGVLRRKLRQKRAASAALAALIVAALLLCAFAALGAPQFLPYAGGLISLGRTEDGAAVVSFNDKATDCAWTLSEFPDGYRVFTVEAWFTSWDSLRGASAPSVVLPLPESGSYAVVYAQNNGEDDVFLLQNGKAPFDGGKTLPRLALGYYLLAVLGAFAVLLLLWLILRRNEKARGIIARALPLPPCYVIAHLAIAGASTVSYTLQRDLALILLLTLILYLAALCAQAVLRARCGVER